MQEMNKCEVWNFHNARDHGNTLYMLTENIHISHDMVFYLCAASGANELHIQRLVVNVGNEFGCVIYFLPSFSLRSLLSLDIYSGTIRLARPWPNGVVLKGIVMLLLFRIMRPPRVPM